MEISYVPPVTTISVGVKIQDFNRRVEVKYLIFNLLTVGTKMEDSAQATPVRSRISIIEILQKTEVAAEVKNNQSYSLLEPSL